MSRHSIRIDFADTFREGSAFSLYTIRRFKDLANRINDRMKNYPVYGKASEKDFGEYAECIAALCAYTNKQYYLYKAIGDKNKIGYLSLKQYRQFQHIKEEDRANWLMEKGRMVTLYKLLDRAIGENPYAKFLRVFKDYICDSDRAKDFFESFSKVLHNMHGYAQVEECTIQEAYNLPLQDLKYLRGLGIGSGERYAVASCMENRPCEEFYKAFGAKAYKVSIQGVDVGRFLTWRTKKGITYIDRLYCNGADAPEALSAIEKKFGFEKTVYYPNCIDADDYVECVDLSLLGEKTYRPYIDSFWHVKYIKEEKKLFLQDAQGNVASDVHFNYSHTPPFFAICECGELLREHQKDFHEFVCPKSSAKIRNKDKYMAIYKLFKERRNEPLY